MILTENDYKYLNGKEFSDGYKLQLQCNPLYTRIDLLKKYLLSRGGTKIKTLHVGCCDHIPLIDEKIRNKTWLHGILDDICGKVIGVDINEKAVKYVNKKAYSKYPVYCADITNLCFFDLVPKDNYDFVVLGEILEHTDNPVSFLNAMRNTMKTVEFKGKYIITVPNALSFLRDRTSRKGIENVNSDHRYWFTPYTISKVMVRAGITPEEILFCNYGHSGNGASIFTRKLLRYINSMVKEPLKFKSWRGDQMIVIGRDGDEKKLL